ncbi:MAG TPA: tetratricopeptide repeat protein [Bacteroidia bacterium]
MSFIRAERTPADSLQGLLKKEKADSTRIKLMLNLADELKFTDPVAARNYIDQSTALSGKANFRKKLHSAYRILGIIYATTGKLDSSKIAFQQSLNLAQKHGNRSDIANAYNNIGVNYYYEGNYLKANENYLLALKEMTSLKNYEGMANAQANLGNVNLDLKKYDEAEKFYLEAAANYKKAGNTIGVSEINNDLGRFYLDKSKDYKKALHFLTISRKDLIANQTFHNVIANYLFSAEASIVMGDYESAQVFSDSSIYYSNFAPDSLRIAQNMVIQTKILMHKGDFKKAKEYIDKALKISKSIQATTVELDAQDQYANLLFKMGNASDAFLRQKEFIKLKDSLFSSETTQQLQALQTIYQTEQKETENKLLQKESELKSLEINDFKTSRIYFIVSLFVAVLIIAGAFLAYRKISRSNKMLAIQKISIEQKNELLEIQKKEVEEKNEEIEEKNKEITDSINYASRIQAALLPDANEFEHLFKESFVLFQPKDIVSGDFYWETSTSEYIFYATADCTGHGVPGGFMSMLGMALLNEIIGEKKIYEPCDILDMMRIKLITTLKQKGVSGENKDGMDMVLCRVKRDHSELVFAAANNPLWLYRDGKIEEYKADKQPVGIYSGGELIQFTQQTIRLQQNDIIYTFTDGFADQFGGPKGKKFKYKQLEEVLISFAHKSLTEQKEELKQRFSVWKGKLEQVDDVCIIGIRL